MLVNRYRFTYELPTHRKHFPQSKGLKCPFLILDFHMSVIVIGHDYNHDSLSHRYYAAYTLMLLDYYQYVCARYTVYALNFKTRPVQARLHMNIIDELGVFVNDVPQLCFTFLFSLTHR